MPILSSLKKLDTFVYLMILGLPIVFFPFVNLDFELAKVVFARSIILLFFLFWGISLLAKDKIKIPSALKEKDIVKCLIFLLAILLVSSFVSIAPKLSFWGGYFRMQGVYTLMHYILFFFLLLFTFQKDLQWRKANNFIFLIYIFLIALSILQFLGVDFLSFREFQNHGDRISASFSNPNFFASFFILLTFPVLSFLNKKNNFYIALIIMLSLFVVVLTGSKGALLGLLFGFLVYALMNVKFLKTKKYLYFLGIIFTLICVLFLAASKIGFLHRFDLNEENLVSTNTRLQIWEDSLKMIEDKPFLGFGIETFPIVFHQYADLEELNADYLFGLIDKPHNTFIEAAYSMGFVGLIIYLFIIYTILKKSLKKLKSISKKHKSEVIAILSGLSAFFVSNLFSFSVTIHFVFLSFYLAYLCYLISDKKTTLKVFKNNTYKKLSGYILVFFVISSLILNNIFYVLADMHAKKGFDALELGDTNAILENFYSADFYNPNQSYFNYFLASLFIEIEEIELAKIYLEKAADFESKEGDFYQFLSEKIY